MDIEALLKSYTTMMMKQSTLATMKTFRSENSQVENKQKKKNARRQQFANVKSHSIYMQPGTEQKKQ